mmetsp:Transcript_26354/g.36744  ORF Transcript_26354/g.36744 Transcript_26354/m.36744 type:complete len:228 (+) Transcript_26354:2836-3519(+)
MVLRNCLGMIMSVSTFIMSRGAAVPETFTNASKLIGRELRNPRTCWIPKPRAWVPKPRAWWVPKAREVEEKDLWPIFRTSARRPVIAAAAAIAGLTRCVLPPRPCLPSKFLLEVDAHLSPGSSLSAFIARHMEHPGSRHSKPASRNTWSKPSSSACFLTRPEPGTIMAHLMLPATLAPRATSATALRSSMRPFVQEPINTLSTSMSSILVPGARPMYSNARLIALAL